VSARSAQAVLSCAELQPTVDFLVDRLAFRLERIAPADDPREADLSGHGLQLLLRRGDDAAPGVLRLGCDDWATLASGERELLAPNGTRIELAPPRRTPEVPAGRQELVVSRAGADAAWVTGRAGMRYRDLIPGRLGGRFVASHIRIPKGGPVPDQVHFHDLRFQVIYCARGWVRVAYEGQGEPFVLSAGDCVLQPPRIRHRVLESSPGLEVVELASPAEHDTCIDHELELPTARSAPEREWAGQRFLRPVAADATWVPCSPGFEARDTGIAEATGGLAGVRVLRPGATRAPVGPWQHAGELLFAFVLAGDLRVEGAGPEPLPLGTGDSVALPAGAECVLSGWADDLQLLEVRLPAGGANGAANHRPEHRS
jgi:quercetin dioxygenase-like cupin family protein